MAIFNSLLLVYRSVITIFASWHSKFLKLRRKKTLAGLHPPVLICLLIYGCGSKWKTDVGPQMEMSSLVLTIHNFGVPNFDPYPYVLRSALVWFKRSEIFVGTTCMRLRLSIHSWSWVLRNQTSMGKAMVSTVSTGNDVYITCFLFGGFSLS